MIFIRIFAFIFLSCSSSPVAPDAASTVCSFGAFVLAFDLHRDCLQRRLVFELSEQIAWLVLQQSAFGRKARAVDETIGEMLVAIWRRFYRDDEKIVFSDSETRCSFCLDLFLPVRIKTHNKSG